MRLKSKCLFVLMLMPAAAHGQGFQDSPAEKAELAARGPCHKAFCNDRDAQVLQDAFTSSETTESQRSKMMETISTHSLAGATDWRSAKLAYFQWRSSQPKGNPFDPNAIGTPAPPPSYNSPAYGQMRIVAEQSVRARLIDPSSAQFSWPFGFMLGDWKPFLQKRVHGWITCGAINAKNRLGGYTGATTFVVVLSEDGHSLNFIDMPDRAGSGIMADALTTACQRSNFPRPQTGMLDDPTPVMASAGGGSIADELTKLVKLRETGVLTSAEFDAQKAKLLNK